MDELHVFKSQTLIGRYELHATELVLGRAGHIVLESPHISRIHALLSFYPDRGYVITDLGSRNGLRVNGKEATEAELKTGDVVELAEFQIRCNFTGQGAVRRAPPIAPREGLADTVEFDQSISVFMNAAVGADHPALERAASGRFGRAVSDKLSLADAPKPEPLKKAEPAKKPEPVKKDEAKKDEPKKDEAKKDDKKPDPAKKDEAKKDEAKKDEAKKDDKKPDPAKKDEAKKPEPKKEVAPKRESVGAEVKKIYDVYFKRLKRLARLDAEPTKADAKPMFTDLRYMKRRHAWRGALRYSWLIACLASVGWMGEVFFRHKMEVFTSESVSKGHEIFGAECAKCHVRPFSLGVPDPACLSCHDGLLTKQQFEELLGARASSWPTHQTNERFTPACATCHVEHGGHPILARAVSDQMCTNCHGDLAANVTSGALAIVTSGGRSIMSLAKHVEFAAVARGVDTATLALNHQRHVGAPLTAMETPGRKAWLKETGRDHMVCADCHQPDASRRYMQPIRFAKHCQQCHALEITKDASLPPAGVPHGIPARVLVDHVKSMGIEAEVQKSFEDYIKDHPDELKAGAGPTKRPGPGQPTPPKPKELTPDEWVAKKMGAWRDNVQPKIVDDLLHSEPKNGCAKCHKLEGAEDAPVIAAPKVPTRWLQNGGFDHEKHRVVSCTECHPKATASTATSDVLLPGVESCQNCHRPNGASANCTLCHLYHDRGSDRRDMDGRVSRTELAPGLERKP